MKMSDAFKTPFIYAGTHFEDRGGNHLQLDDFDKSQAAVQAINSHDALVELSKELTQALKYLIAANECKELPTPEWVSRNHCRAVSAYNKAKELLKEQGE